MDVKESNDFDGDTQFQKLTAEQKLLWLSQAGSFVDQFKGKVDKEDSEKE